MGSWKRGSYFHCREGEDNFPLTKKESPTFFSNNPHSAQVECQLFLTAIICISRALDVQFLNYIWLVARFINFTQYVIWTILRLFMNVISIFFCKADLIFMTTLPPMAWNSHSPKCHWLVTLTPSFISQETRQTTLAQSSSCVEPSLAFATGPTSTHQRIMCPGLYKKIIGFLRIVVWHMRVSACLLEVTWLES